MKKFLIGAAVCSVLLTACGTTSNIVVQNEVGSVTTSGISADRCKANQAVGQITYLTSYDYASSASIIDTVAAEANGYFKKMCLDVKLQSGFTTDNVPLVSAGKAAFSSLSSASEVAADVEAKSNIEAIAMYGHKAVDELAVTDKANVTSLAQIKGTTMGVEGSIPYDIREMLVNNGVSLDSFKQEQVPFDPTLLDKNSFQSRPVYKSGEPYQLDQAGIKYHVFDPSTQPTATTSTFGAMIVNKTFAAAHPTATEDFLRADLQGFQWSIDNPTAAVKAAFDKSDPKYYLTSGGENFRWATEATLVKQSTPTDEAFGYMADQEWASEMQAMTDALKIVPAGTDIHKYYDTKYFNAVHDGTKLIWPAS